VSGSTRSRPSNGLRSKRLLVLMAALALGVTAGCTAGSGISPKPKPDRIGAFVVPSGQRRPAPDLTGSTLSGTRFDLSQHERGRTTLVNVWASWCEPCRREMPLLARAAADHASGLQVLGLDERDHPPSARAFTASVGATYPSLVDPDSRLLMRLPMLPHDAVPSSLFIDPQGRVAARVIGPITSQQLTSVLTRLREGS
jgi:thiol-disulfide isomerase/thioredoxin